MAKTQSRAAEAGASAEPVAAARPKPRRVYLRKDDIVLDAAEKCFVEVGYASTSMDAVAERAGVSKRTIYSNFRSKESLFAAVVRKGCAGVLPHALDDVDMNTANPERVLTQLAERFLSDIYSKPRVQMYQTVVAASRRFPQIGRMMFETSIAQSAKIFDQFFRAQAANGNLVYPDVDLVAVQFVALLKTDLHLQLCFSMPAKVGKRHIKRTAEACVQLFLNGARPR